jgi:putative heme transporter
VTPGKRRLLRVLASLGVLGVTGLIVADVPHLTGATWSDVTFLLGRVGTGTAFAIAGLWAAGLVVYTIAMTASMPGLSHSRALALNLSGSSVSNVLPFGGLLGTGVNAVMVRSWRLSLRSFASSAAALNVVNLLAKLALPIIAGLVVSRQPGISPLLGRSAFLASGATAVVAVGVVAALISRRWAAKLDGLLVRLDRRRGRTPAVEDGPGPITSLQSQVRDIFRLRWTGLVTGLTGYVLLQWALFALCLHTAGITGNPGAVFAAFAVERALTLAVVTPAGTGVAEAGAAGLLVALGFAPAASAAGVLLYRLFVYLAEIPVGALVLAGWASMRMRSKLRIDRLPAGTVSTIPNSTTPTPPAASSR